MLTRNHLIALAVLTMAGYVAAAATGFDNILAALWIVPAIPLVVGVILAWRRKRESSP